VIFSDGIEAPNITCLDQAANSFADFPGFSFRISSLRFRLLPCTLRRCIVVAASGVIEASPGSKFLSIHTRSKSRHTTMASRPDHSPSPPHDLSGSQLTIPSDSEAYSSLSPPSPSPPQSSDNNGPQPVIIYQPPTLWGILRGAAINLLLPFVNGMMLGLGELLAHEFAFRLGWSSTNV